MAAALALQEDGWLQGAAHTPSDNQAPRPPAGEVALAVIHGISLPPGEFGGDAVARLFTNALDCSQHPYFEALRGLRVSAHFFIARAGALTQFVPVHCGAWHAGASQWRGRDNCNDFSIGIELEGDDATPYADIQYQMLAALLGELIRHYPALAVAGHCHIAPARKTDPGDAFDWARLFGAIGTQHDGRPAA